MDGLPGTTLRLSNTLRCNLLHCPINCVYLFLFIDSSESGESCRELAEVERVHSKRTSWERYRNLLNQSNQPLERSRRTLLDFDCGITNCGRVLLELISLSGTSLLIVVGVAIETAKQVEGRVIKRRYQGFIQ